MHPVFLEIGPLEIRYYGLMYAIAFFLGLHLGKKYGKEIGLKEKIVEDFAFTTMICGLIGGRLYYVLLQHEFYFANPSEIIAVWHGGMAIHGGIIGAILGAIVFSRINKVDGWKLADVGAAPFILGQAIGRIGNFTNGDAHGVPTFTPMKVMLNNNFNSWWEKYLSGGIENTKELVPWGMVFPPGTPAGNEFPNLSTHPVMIYEMILNFIAFLSIWFIFRKKDLPKGSLFLIYLMEYAVIRSIVTIFRADDLMIWGLRAPHLISIIMIIIPGIILAKKLKKVE